MTAFLRKWLKTMDPAARTTKRRGQDLQPSDVKPGKFLQRRLQTWLNP
jgi:hypothetical protein